MQFSHLLAGLLALAPAVFASPVTTPTIENHNSIEQRSRVGRGGFWASCEECKLNGVMLKCVCTKDDGIHVRYSNLNLNQCIGVDGNHNLIWEPHGDFASKCDKIGASLNKVEIIRGMSLPVLRASCNKDHYRPDAFGSSFINLDHGISVNDGKLACNGSN